MHQTRTRAAWLLAIGCMIPMFTASAANAQKDEEIYPVHLFLAKKKQEFTYPSVAGDTLVFTARHHDGGDVFEVWRTSTHEPDVEEALHVPTQVAGEDIRFGVATTSGVGYVSNRMGPISAWLWSNDGDMHTALGGYLTYRGAMIPHHLNASRDGRYWCFDDSLEKVRHNELLQEFGKSLHKELRGQMWRIYDSNFYRRKDAYRDNAQGTKNRFSPPVLFVFDRQTSSLSMIPNAFDGAISPDGRHIAFVREDHGNYDLWMQDIDGGNLRRLTNSAQGEYEPAFSPDGSQLAFVSNRDSDGNVRHTSIYVMDLASGEVRRITFSSRVSDGGPAWIDERHIVFHSNRDDKPGRVGDDWRLWQVSF